MQNYQQLPGYQRPGSTASFAGQPAPPPPPPGGTRQRHSLFCVAWTDPENSTPRLPVHRFYHESSMGGTSPDHRAAATAMESNITAGELGTAASPSSSWGI